METTTRHVTAPRRARRAASARGRRRRPARRYVSVRLARARQLGVTAIHSSKSNRGAVGESGATGGGAFSGRNGGTLYKRPRAGAIHQPVRALALEGRHRVRRVSDQHGAVVDDASDSIDVGELLLRCRSAPFLRQDEARMRPSRGSALVLLADRKTAGLREERAAPSSASRQENTTWLESSVVASRRRRGPCSRQRSKGMDTCGSRRRPSTATLRNRGTASDGDT